jgi:hypothetical protein
MAMRVQGPQLSNKAVGPSTFQQGLFDFVEPVVGQPGRWSGRTSAAQAVSPLGLPALVPELDSLAGDAELAGDLGLAKAGGE